MRGCSTNEVKKGEIAKMFLKQRLDVCALRVEVRLCLVRWWAECREWREGGRRKGLPFY